jgi:mono/diheme cytochrome c family protein
MTIPFTYSDHLGALALLTVLVLLVAACSEENPTAPENLPADHTVQQGGVFHARGLESPEVNCVECHGSNLRGGDDGEPSCFRCHGQEWSALASRVPGAALADYHALAMAAHTPQR